MLRSAISLLVIALVLVVPASSVEAQTPPTTEAAAPSANATLPLEAPPALRWLMRGPVESGLTIAGGALLGAVVAVFSFIGGDVPGTVGAADLKRRRAELKVDRKEIEDILNKSGNDADARGRLADLAERERALAKEQGLQRWVAGALYVLGGLLAALLFAETLWEAVGLGLVGPAAVGVLLKSRAQGAVSALAIRFAEEGVELTEPIKAATGNEAKKLEKVRKRKMRLARALTE